MSKIKKFRFFLYLSMFIFIYSCSARNNIGAINMTKKTGKIFNYNNFKLNYNEAGTGDSLILIHGFAASSYSWRFIEKSFKQKYKVISIDLKGFGLSDKPLDTKYSVEDQAKIICEFISQNNLSNITLIGHSFGGAVSLVTYLIMNNQDTNNIKKLILIDTACYVQQLPDYILLLRIPILNKLSLSFIPSTLNAKFVLQKAFYDNNKINREMINTYGFYLNLPGSHHALIQTANMIASEIIKYYSQMYKSIHIPVLIIWGEEDEIIPISVGKKLHNNIPNSLFYSIKQCGHNPHEEKPDEVIQIISKFL